MIYQIWLENENISNYPRPPLPYIKNGSKIGLDTPVLNPILT